MRQFLDSLRPATFIFCFALLPVAVFAQETGEEAAEEDPLWKAAVGFSYLATSGNSDTSSSGLKLEAIRRPSPWGLEIKAFVDRADDNGEITAERYFAGLRGTRSLSEKLGLFAGLSFEQDEFSGIELRTLVEAGITYTAKNTERHLLEFDLGVTWTDEDRLAPAIDSDSLGAVLGMNYEWKISETAKFSQSLAYFPNFDESDDWRAESLTALTAALTDRFALQVGYEVRYRNLPVGDREETDTSTKASLVWTL